MASIKNFVNIDIKHQEKYTEPGTRPTVLLFVKGDLPTYTDSDKNVKNQVEADTIYEETPSTLNDTTLKAYFDIFFDNGGVKLMIKNNALPTTADDFKKLGNDYIILATTEDTYQAEKYPTTGLDSLVGIDRKILVLRKTSIDNLEESKNVAVKYSNVLGAEMTIAAYLSQIDVYDEEKVKDYDFTVEYDVDDDVSGNVDNTGSLSEIKYNFEMKIVDTIRNIGGNMTDGNSLVEEFITIILQQTLSYTLINALSKKLKGQSGMAAIRTAMSEELNRYVSSGFLVTDKVWTNPDLVAKNPVDNKVEKTVIKKNTPISSGYYLYFFPLANNYREVGVFLVIATAKGIRYIEVDGRAI